MKKLFRGLLLGCIVCLSMSTVSAAKAPEAVKAPIGKVDSISSASGLSYSNDAKIKFADGTTMTAAEKGITPFWAAGSDQLKYAMDSNYDVVAPSISTTNVDGSPNVAIYYVSPVKGTDYKYVTFTGGNYVDTVEGTDKSNTFQNLRDRKLGVVMYYQHQPELYPRTSKFAKSMSIATEETVKSFKYLRNQGARVIIKLVEDKAKIAELKTLNGDALNNALYLEVVKVYPMG